MTLRQRMRYQGKQIEYKWDILQCNLRRNVLRRFDQENFQYLKYYLFGKVSSRITMAACTMQMGVAIYPASKGRKKNRMSENMNKTRSRYYCNKY